MTLHLPNLKTVIVIGESNMVITGPPTTFVNPAPPRPGCIPDIYMFRNTDGKKTQVNTYLGYSCCIDQVRFEIWEVNHHPKTTEIVFQKNTVGKQKNQVCKEIVEMRNTAHINERVSPAVSENEIIYGFWENVYSNRFPIGVVCHILVST